MNINEHEYGEGRYFRTTNFNIACFLFAKDFELVNIDRITNSKKAIFVFRDNPDREFLIQKFNFAPLNSPDVLIDVRKLISSTKMLKDKLYQDY